MLPAQRSKHVLRILGKLRQKGVPSPDIVDANKEGIDFDAESLELGPDTIASPATKPSLNALLKRDDEELDEEELNEY